MPSASVLEQKKQIVASVADRISNSCAGVIVDYKGISVADDTALRKELREAGVEYTVVKNTLLKLAINGTSLESMSEVLDGTTAHLSQALLVLFRLSPIRQRLPLRLNCQRN